MPALPERRFLRGGAVPLVAQSGAAYRQLMITVRGGCHCRAVRFTARLGDPPVPALDCNCSICRATGFLHIMVPHADFTLESGREVLTRYRFGTGAAEHLFCSRCGIKSFYQPRSHPEAWSVNAHCLDHPVNMEVSGFDGQNWESAAESLPGRVEPSETRRP